MKALVHPFTICHSIIPVLPRALMDYLEAPVPLLIGLSKQQLIDEGIEMTSKTPITWIDLEPDRLGLGLIDITCRERGLAGAGWRRDPHGWVLAFGQR